MTGRFHKFIRTISNGERSRTGAPAPYSYCQGPDQDPARAASAGAAPLGYTPQQQMNLLHKATDKLRLDSGDKGKHRNDSHDRASKADKRKHAGAHDRIPPFEISIEMESPPLTMYGTTVNSTGALMSGIFKLNVIEAKGVTLDTLELKFVIEQEYKKPVEKGCPECTIRKTLLRHWRFIREETFYPYGAHRLPFSYLIGGHLPASTDVPLGSIKYILYGTAIPSLQVRASTSSSGSADATTGARNNSVATHSHTHSRSSPSTPVPADVILRKELSVFRAITPPELDRKAIRVFPPTNLKAECELPPLIHPITNGFQVQLKITGVSEHAEMGKTVRNWKLKKLTWRLEEHCKSISIACDKHNAKLLAAKDKEKDKDKDKTKDVAKGKGLLHEETSTLGGLELREGWKSDYSPPELNNTKGSGSIEMELTCGPRPRAQNERRPACDVETPSGFSVHHKLVIECVVTEEMHPIDKPKWCAPTGVARILRMGFEIKLTERSGMGIAWDEEQPPMYEDVPESPPRYVNPDAPPLGDDLTPLPAGVLPIPGRAEARTDGEPWEEPPSYVDNRATIADDEEWNAEHVHLHEGIRPDSAARSGSRGWSATGVGEGPSGSSQLRSPNVRATRLDASDLEAEPYADMMRGRDRQASSATAADLQETPLDE